MSQLKFEGTEGVPNSVAKKKVRHVISLCPPSESQQMTAHRRCAVALTLPWLVLNSHVNTLEASGRRRFNPFQLKHLDPSHPTSYNRPTVSKACIFWREIQSPPAFLHVLGQSCRVCFAIFQVLRKRQSIPVDG